ncbi:glycosyltransferase [Weissella halotolerans DSM 20190]|uniref:Glycosyltransferase n=2 Tax=Weissella halotolerans TaxID=1615 RepID=A0A0R2G190_9LACO|nr:glycosyltransferase [Weissella halotolerans DSM 20190]
MEHNSYSLGAFFMTIHSSYWWKQTGWRYSLLFLLVTCFIFLPYALTGTSLVWQADGITQHIPALAQWQHDLKQLIIDHQWPSQWDWHLGLGGDYYQTFAYYTIGDIFTYGVALVKPTQLVTYYNVMIVVRLFLAGSAFLVAAKHFLPNRHYWINALAAITYVFSGYTAFAAFEHPFFINPLIIFPLLLVSLDQVLRRGRWLPFTLMVAWTLWNNYYFAFMLAIGAFIFWVLRSSYNHYWHRVSYQLRLILSTMLGFCLAAPLFIPGFFGVLSSARTGSPLANGLTVYPLYYYLKLPSNLLTNYSVPDFWLTGGLTAITLLGLVFTLHHFKQYRLFNTIWLLAGFGLCLPFFSALLNGGSSPSNRWVFMLSLPLALTIIVVYDHREQVIRQDYVITAGLGVVATLSIFYGSHFNLRLPFGLIIASFFATLLGMYLTKQRPIWQCYCLIGLTVLNVILITGQNHTTSTDPAKSDYLSNQEVKTLISNQQNYRSLLDVVNIPATTSPLNRVQIDEQLSNAQGIAPGNNLPILAPSHNIGSYWSIQNGQLGQLSDSLALNGANKNDVLGNLDNRNTLSNILGVQQRFENDASLAPASYHADANLVKVNGQIPTFSKDAFPLAYLPKHQVSFQQYQQANPTEREAMLADSVVVKDTNASSDHSDFANQVKTAGIRTDQTKAPVKNLHFTYHSHPALMDDGIFLSPDANLKHTELHLEIRNIQFKPANFIQRRQAALADYDYRHQEDSRNPKSPIDRRYNPTAYQWNWTKKHLTSAGNELGGYTLTAKYHNKTAEFSQTSQKNLSFYQPHQAITLNLGPASGVNKETFIPLSFSQVGTYSFDVSVRAMPTGQSFNQVAKSAQSHAVPLTWQNNHLSGKVKTATSRIIATTIPYSKGWQDKQLELVNVNNGFLGIRTHAGMNTINLHYHTPGLKLGIILGLIGLDVLFILAYLSLRRHQKR